MAVPERVGAPPGQPVVLISPLMALGVDALGDIGLHDAVEHEFGEISQEILAAQLRKGVLK